MDESITEFAPGFALSYILAIYSNLIFILHGIRSYFDIMWLKSVNNPSKHEKHLIRKYKQVVKLGCGWNRNQHVHGSRTRRLVFIPSNPILEKKSNIILIFT